MGLEQYPATIGGRLELEFALDPKGRTHIGRQFFSYPFHFCRPFYLDEHPCEGLATAYTQSCSGGLYGRDRLMTSIVVREGAQAHLTTQASTIVHRATEGTTEQSCIIAAEADALIEYLPDPMILFPGANLKSSVQLALAENARAIIFDSFLAHDYDGESRLFTLLDNSITIRRPSGAPLVIDRSRITGEEFMHGGIGRAGGFACHGSVLAATPGMDADSLIDSLRKTASAFGGCAIGISRLPRVSGLSARILAHDAVPMRKAMMEIWRQFRTAATGSEPRPRRK